MKKTNKLISILLVLAMLLSVTPLSFITSAAAEITPTEPTLTTDKYDVNGDDTKDAVYEITTASELYWFAGLVNGTLSGVTKNNSANAILMNNITVNENVIVDDALTTDISNLVVWTAIGKSFSSTSQFKGHFDGNNKTISGLYVNDTVTYRGFVGYLGGSVKNLTIADSYFYSTNTSLGAIAGSAASGSSIENCKLTGSIVSGKGSVGGIVGYVAAGVTLTNCHTSESEISGTADKIGGIVGSAGGNNSSNKSYIRLCAVTDSSVTGDYDVGGILGRGGSLSYTYIIGCCNYGTDVTATTKNAGGIVGYYAAIYSSFSSAKVSAPTKQGPFYGASANAYASAYDSTIYGEAINYASSKCFTTDEIKSGIAAYYLANSTSSSTNAYSQWGQKIGEDEYPVWNADNNADYIVYREDDPDAEGGYRYYNGDAAAAYEPNEDGIYEITNRLDWYKFAKKSKEDPTINGILTDNIDFSAVISDKIGDYRIGEDDAYTGSFDGDGYTVSGLPQMELPLFDTIGSGGELKNLTLSGATVNYISSTPAVGLVENNNGTVSGCAVSDITIIGSTSSAMIGTNRGTVTNCTATNITVAGKSAAAGIVYLNTGTIEKCNVVSGTVKAVHTENYDSHAGGICVRSGAGTIRECSNNADVTSESSSTAIYAAAGIVAAPSDSSGASVQVIKCFNSGDIKGGYAGGISGYDNTSAYVNISLCYNEGAITGGIAGGIAASGSYNASDKILNCYNAGDVNATSKAGGIAGEQGNCIIENCHNYAKIVSSNVGASIVGYSSGVWPGPDKLINNHAIEGNVEASYVSPYLDTKGAASNFDAITVGSTREEFADGTITAKLNAGNSETVWYQHSEYPILEQRHMHKWEYTLVGTDSIKAKCVNAGCDLDNNDGGSMTIVAPAELVYDGTSKDADCTYNEWKPGKPAIVYNDIDRTNVTGQNIVASVTAGEATASVSYQIQPCEIIASMVTLSKTSVSYNGTEQSTTVTVKYDTNTTLTASVDYEITGTTSATEISTGDGYAVTVTGKGNYIGTVTKYWKINKGSLSTQLILEGWNYLDTPNEPYVTNNPENAEVTYTYYISTGRRPVMTGSANGAETEGGVPSYAGTYYIGAVIAATEHYNSKTISPVAFTIAPREVNNPDFEGLQETYLYDNGNEIKPAFTLKDDKGNVISDSEYTVVYSDNTDSGKATITITDNAGGNYNVSGSTKFTIITHQHDWIYSANGDTITATCANTDTGCLDTNGGTLKIFAPADLYVDGITAKEATIENNLVDTSVAISDITYSAPYGLPPKDAGTYTAGVTVGGATATVEFTLLNYAAKVTDKDGNELEGSPYKTFAAAVRAAEKSEGSTVNLLDDITLSSTQYVYSGTFTLDLNGKTLLNETAAAISIESDADVTIKDSGEGGIIESKTQSFETIYNYGTLTVESGIIKGDGGIDNRGTLNFKNGKIEADKSQAIINFGTAYIHNGILESSSNDAIRSNPDATIYVYGGEFSGSAGIVNHGTAFIEGGEFTGKSYAALNLLGGTVEVTGGSFTGTDFESGYYSGTPYGEYTVYCNEGATLTLKGGEFPNGFVVANISANTFLAEDYYYKDADGKLITVSDDAKVINGYVKVTKGADLSEAVITVDKTEFVYNGQPQAPAVTVTIGGKTLKENVDYAVNARRWENNVPVQWFYYVDAGVYLLTINGMGDYTGKVEKEFVIKPATVDIIWEGDEFYYTGNPHKVTAKYVDVNGDESNEFELINYVNTNVGVYTATAIFADNNYSATEATINHTYEIKWYDGAPDATVSGTKGENGWYTSEVTVTAPEGYTISTAVDGTYGSEITFGNEENAVYYLKQTENGYIAKVELGEIKCDLADPAAEITMAENNWNSFFNTVTFGYFFKETQSITITASDEISGIAKIEYFIATEEITDFENIEWNEYTEKFNIEPNSKNIIYAKATDKAGRYVIVNSDGIVLYTDSKAVTSEATYILTSMEDVEFEIDFNGNEVAYIMHGGSYLVDPQYTATENGIKLHANYIENAYTAGEYRFTVYVDPLGENFGYEGIGYDEYIDSHGDTPETITLTLTVKKLDGNVEITNDISKTYDGKAVSDPEYDIIGTGDVTVEYKVKGADDNTYTTEAPVNAGEYTVRVSVAETGKSTAASATKDFTIAKKAVTVTATAPDKVYDGTDAVDMSNVILIFEGVVEGDEVNIVIKNGIFTNSNVGENKRVIIAYTASGEDLNNYKFPEDDMIGIPEADPNLHYAFAVASITAKDISDGFIILGDPLTYNGKEQTQTVEKVIPTGTAPEATYTVSGNKATNVGVYLLTVTGTGNFTGEAKIAYEIAVDMNGVDFEQLHLLNVKATDREKIEYIYNQVDNAVTDLASDEKKAEWDNLKSTCVELLKMIESVENHIESFENELAKYDIDTVTSDDTADLERFQNSVGKFYNDYYDNLTDEQIKKVTDIYSAIEDLETRISDVAEEITRITNAVNSYDEATVKSSDRADIEQLIADIKVLADGQNITADERAKLENLDATADALLAKIAETKSEYDRVIAAANGYDKTTVTSDNKEALIQLDSDIFALALTNNVTAEEKNSLMVAHSNVFYCIQKITYVSDEIKRIVAELEKYVFESVKSSDKADIQQLIADIKTLLDTQNITADERTLLEGADETCTKLIAKIDETVAEINRINDATNAYDIDTVTSADKADIEKLLADIKALTDGDNITDAEREQLNGNEATLNALLDKIGATADEIARIETAVNGYDEESVKSTDKDDLEQLVEDIKALTDATNITENERTKLGELDATVDSLIKKIDDTAAEIERIDEAVNGYDKETVKSDDIPELGKLIDDIKTLTDGDNLTEDEKAALEEADKAIDDLVEKLTEVAEEIKRVDEAVKSYDEETVKSTDSEDLTQLKEDIQALIDSDNTTENEKTALEEMIKDIEGLEDKIAETEQQLEEIKDIENGYNPETVTSDDKAAIEDKIAEIEAVNPDNLTDEQKAEYEEIKAGFEALLEEIAAAEKDVADIGVELEMFDEERVTKFREDDIEALKAKIDELLADENMGETEKAKLNEYKAQAEKLIEIINTPKEYISCRFFYLIWDCLNWKYNGILWLFSKIFSC